MRRGASREFDHCCIIHCIWLRAAQLGAQLWVHRVPTKLNLGDPPSREEFGLVSRLGRFKPPELDAAFYDPSAWAALALRNCFA